MKDISLLLKLMDLELSLLVCKAKSKVVSADELWDMTSVYASEYMEVRERLVYSGSSELVYQLFSSIQELCAPSAMVDILPCNEILVVFQSGWDMDLDGLTERQTLIGHSGFGFHFGTEVSGNGSMINWSKESFYSIEDAKHALCLTIEKSQ